MRITSLVYGLLWFLLLGAGACGGTEPGAHNDGSAGDNQGTGGRKGTATGGVTSRKSTSAQAGEATAGDGGASETGGTTAVGNTGPLVSPGPSDKLDLLLMIDNSLSMGDKQTVLATAVPQLLARLANPNCVSSDNSTAPAVMTGPDVSCPNGMHREFTPLADIHIGVVSSSLGDYGGDVCPESETENPNSGFPDQNDHGWLLGALPRVKGLNVVTADFLAWSKDDASNYGSRIVSKTQEFRNFVAATGEVGCGLEMPLESWYRFLVDPKPPVDVVNPVSGMSVRGDVDQSILAQRKQFLRSDSVVAVVMLSDENDCSLRDTKSFSWVPATSKDSFRMWRASKACTTNPNDECCFSCMMVGLDGSIPQKCLDADPTCKRDNASKLAIENDSIGLRCMNMKQRFGFDFLFPVTRYANALTKPILCPEQSYGDLDCDCTAAKAKGVACVPGAPVANPLYANLDPSVIPSGPDRVNASQVLFVGILGVPWQDLATDAALVGDVPLEYKPANRLNWDLFAPASDAVAPLDPFMVESEAPRTGTHPVTGEALQPVTAARNANRINGHEWKPTGGDLQYACTFSLEQPIVDTTNDATQNCVEADYCAGAADARKCARQFVGCSCKGVNYSDDYMENSPVCQKADGTYSTLQTQAKAYPSLRELKALRAFYEQTQSSNNAIVASICPKDLSFSNRQGSGYGYNPAVNLLVQQLTPLLK